MPENQPLENHPQRQDTYGSPKAGTSRSRIGRDRLHSDDILEALASFAPTKVRFKNPKMAKTYAISVARTQSFTA